MGCARFLLGSVLLAHLSGTRHFFRQDVLELYGNFGVRVFFVNVSLRAFYLRRAYRILPAAYAFMIVVIAAHWRTLSWTHIVTTVATPATYSGPPLRILFRMLWGHRGLEHPFPVALDAPATGCALAMMPPQLRNCTAAASIAL
jgi:hypothetical protein